MILWKKDKDEKNFYHKWSSFPFYHVDSCIVLKASNKPRQKGDKKKKKKEKEHEKAESNERDKAKDIRIIKRLTIHGGYISSRWRSLESA